MEEKRENTTEEDKTASMIYQSAGSSGQEYDIVYLIKSATIPSLRSKVLYDFWGRTPRRSGVCLLVERCICIYTRSVQDPAARASACVLVLARDVEWHDWLSTVSDACGRVAGIFIRDNE